MIPAAWLASTAFLAVPPAVVPFMGCPQVHELKAPVTTPGFNIVFVPAGFTTATDLDNFKCAVAVLAKGLRDDPVWQDHDCQIGLYRMDLTDVAQGIGIDASCTDEGCKPASLDTSPWMNGCPVDANDPLLAGQSIWPNYFVSSYSAGFGIQHCRRNLCRFVWPSPDGEATLRDVVDRCAPPAQAIVVIANSVVRGGGGDASPDASGPGIAIVTVDNIAKPSAWSRLAHEPGHVTGLLDEYGGSGQYDASPDDYICGRNLFTLTPPDASDPACAKASWEPQCSPHAQPDCGPDPNAPCQTVVDENCNRTCREQTSPEIALYEGAFGQDCNYFRSENLCLMRDYSAGACQVCRAIIDDAIDREAGQCRVHFKRLRLIVEPDWQWDICPTGPRPPIPPGDDPRVRAPVPSNPLCARHDLTVGAIYARVVTSNGVRAEVAVRRAWVDREPPLAPSQALSMEVTQGRGGSSHRLQLQVGDRNVSASEWTGAIDQFVGAKKRPILRVIDDVTGARWTAEELIVDVELPK